MFAEESLLAPRGDSSVSGSMQSLDLSVLQVMSVKVEGRNGPRAGTLTAGASIKSIFGSEAPPNGLY